MIRDETARIATNRAKTVRFPSIRHDSHEIRETHRTQSKSATAFNFEPGLPFWGRFVSKLGALGSKLGAVLVASWLQPRPTLGALGSKLRACWGTLGPCWCWLLMGGRGSKLGSLGPSWLQVGGAESHIGSKLELFGACLAPS